VRPLKCTCERCRFCKKRAYLRVWVRRNPERIRQLWAASYYRNREKKNARTRAYFLKNKVRMLQEMAARYANCPDFRARKIAQAKIWRATNLARARVLRADGENRIRWRRMGLSPAETKVLKICIQLRRSIDRVENKKSA
jgi:hypothetical protein